ncbi:TetR family transcriptional regulator C-terminal domain-containing protein [Nocardia sp. NPDC051570]|uniref:TetR/AcrR family transcriptional regulator n=1 Tax=Nocardia sp. NPDC051570 TaxID=3364324 RepID=UPI003787D8A2
MPERLLVAALDLFHSQGYHGTGIGQITAVAGVPKGSFYNYFSSKEAMAVAALLRYAAESPFALLFDKTVGGPVERVRAHFEAHRDIFVASGYRRGCLMGAFATEIADHSEQTRATLTALFNSWGEVVGAVLAEAQAEGAISAGLDPRSLGEYIVQSWEGALIHALATKNDAPLQVFFDTTFDKLLVPDPGHEGQDG